METTEQAPNKPARDELGRLLPGNTANPGGRPKNTLKDYLKRKLSNMTDEEKEAWLRANRINPELQWQMAEGRPSQNTDITSDGEQIKQIPIYGGVSKHPSNEKDIQPDQKDQSG